MYETVSEPLRGELIAEFSLQFGSTPTSAVRVPGRVNLIGEHIDYSGLPVLPMAIQRNTLMLFRSRSDRVVRIASTERAFPPRSFSLGSEIELSPSGDWGNYVKAAAQEIAAQYDARRGFDGLVYTTIPIAAGLSSSSALVVATALALLDVNSLNPEPFELMEALASAERHVGTKGGGMDQAVLLGARARSAVQIAFRPLRLEIVPIPPDWRFVVAHSLTRAEKSGAHQKTYNNRVAECAAALDIMLDGLGLTGTVDGYPGLIDEVSATRLLDEAERFLDGKRLRRFRHVVSETDRVLEAQRAMNVDDLQGFGSLMTASHISLRDNYEVSTKELDAIVSIAEAVGAAGARLTGAGLGGCAIALCAAGDETRVMDAIRAEFYAPHGVTESLDVHLFVAEPSSGACTMPL